MENQNPSETEAPVEVKSISSPPDPNAPVTVEPAPLAPPTPEPAPPAPPTPLATTVDEVPVEPAAPVEPVPPTPPTGIDNVTLTENLKPPRSVKHIAKIFGLGLLIFLVLFAVTAAAAELGFVNTGIDKLYGRTKLAALWGGIPANNETALTLLLTHPSKTPKNFSGQLNLNIDGEFRSLFNYSALTPTDGVEIPGLSEDNPSNSPDTIRFNSFPKAAGPINQPFALKNYAQMTESELDPQVFPFNYQLGVEFAFLNDFNEAKVNIGLTSEGFLKDELGINDVATEIIFKNRAFYIKVPQNIPQEAAATYNFDPSWAGKYYKIEVPEEQWQKFKDVYAEAENSDLFAEYSDEQKKALIKLTAKYTDRVGIERVNGKPAVHYRIEMDTEKLVESANEAIEIFSSNTTKQDIEEIKEGIGDVNIVYDFWIQYGSYLTVKTDVDFSIASPMITLNADLGSTNQSIAYDSITINAPDTADVIDFESNPTYNPQAQARDATRKSDLRQIASLIEAYGADNKQYPISTEKVIITETDVLDSVFGLDSVSEQERRIVSTIGPNVTNDYYTYQTDAEGNVYSLTAILEACDTDCVYSYPEGVSLSDEETKATAVNDLGTTKGRDQKRKDDLSAVGDALAIYQRENKKYPVANKIIKLSDDGNAVQKAIKDILSPLPNDPTPDTFYYGYSSNGTTATLTAVMEDSNEVNCTVSGNYCIYQYKLGN